MGYPYYGQNQQSQVSYMIARGREMAFNYPIAPGNTIIFKDEAIPYIYVKTMGYSPIDQPVFEAYKREDAIQETETVNNQALEKIQEDIKGIIEDVDGIKRRLNNKPRRKDGEDDPQ